MSSVDDGGYRKEGQNCIYRGNQCSFEGTIPETIDTAHVDIGNLNMFDGETAFRPLLEMRVRDEIKIILVDIIVFLNFTYNIDVKK